MFKDKIALVTGSGRGLGRSCARVFAREGARVVVVDIDAAGGEETVKLIKETGGEALFARADVSKSAEVQAAVRAAVDTFGGLDCAVNNAVLDVGRHPVADISDEDWERSIAVNLTGVFLCMKYEIKAMLERGGGAIVNVGSGNEFGCAPGVAWYLAAKHGLYGLTKVASMDYVKQGIRVNAVGPGVMMTPAMQATLAKNPEHKTFLDRLCPTGRVLNPDEVAEAIVWTCSDKASAVIGHTLTADGGASLT